VSEDSITIEDVVLKPGSKKGDGFSSDIAAVHFKASFNGEVLDKVYIAKYAPEGNRGEMLKLVRLLRDSNPGLCDCGVNMFSTTPSLKKKVLPQSKRL